ncbi:MAG: response regulator transcription factor [Chitinophagaceae bacterium]|jgi:DNA-binding NarL/FixJ family response regulator|nr:response regulator transcription factor [Chitinophagaceae bacterium]MBK8299817.1 response regulator transcription factor [Chitinophagaceae bacterium]MBK9659018.1 response regulator transcription factor [Chitinophagaceae bacterium]MBK9937460.1 response regulator transcription factor [Chitinophagaceae bacterium]MBP6416560.1 response regulator transcription factor [Chitinophagaceae bacterium]
MITILIIDDHPLVGDGIAMMLREVETLTITEVCKTGKDAMESLSKSTPDIILLDISLPDIDGLELCSLIRKKNKHSKIIGLTSTNEAGIITQLLAKGGNGYMLKNMERSELLMAIDEVLNGKIFLSKAANQKILEQFNSVNDAVKNTPLLTRREKEVLKLLYEGLTGPQIAEKLFLSHYTIESHRKNLMQKLNVNSVQQLLKVAGENKLI